jgi:hypothetical protein
MFWERSSRHAAYCAGFGRWKPEGFFLLGKMEESAEIAAGFPKNQIWEQITYFRQITAIPFPCPNCCSNPSRQGFHIDDLQ